MIAYMRDGFSGADTVTYIAKNYPWEASAYGWAVKAYGDKVNLRNYVNEHGGSKEVFLITQYFINGWEGDSDFNSTMESIRQGGSYTINTTLNSGGHSFRLPTEWPKREGPTTLQIAFLSKKQVILHVFSIAVICVLCIVLFFRNSDAKNLHASNPGYVVRYYTHPLTDDYFEATVPVPMVSGRIDNDLRKTINDASKKSFVAWMHEPFKYAKLIYPYTLMASDRYMSAMLTITFSDRITTNHEICNTFDMKTGDIVYLSDLVEVDESFASLIMTKGYAKVDRLSFEAYEDSDWSDYEFPQKILNGYDKDDVYANLQLCSEPFDEENWTFKPTFYLRSNRLYLLNIFNEYTELYIELEDIEEYLKVEKW